LLHNGRPALPCTSVPKPSGFKSSATCVTLWSSKTNRKTKLGILEALEELAGTDDTWMTPAAARNLGVTVIHHPQCRIVLYCSNTTKAFRSYIWCHHTRNIGQGCGIERSAGPLCGWGLVLSANDYTIISTTVELPPTLNLKLKQERTADSKLEAFNDLSSLPIATRTVQRLDP